MCRMCLTLCLYQAYFCSNCFSMTPFTKWLQLDSCNCVLTSRSIKGCKKTLLSQLFGSFQDEQKKQMQSRGCFIPKDILVRDFFTVWFAPSFLLICYLILTASMDACFGSSDNRVLCDLWRKTTFCYGHTNKWVDFLGQELIWLF